VAEHPRNHKVYHYLSRGPVPTSAECRDQPYQMELIKGSQDRIGELDPQITRLEEIAELTQQSGARMERFAAMPAAPVKKLEYRTAGEYVADVWQAGVGNRDAQARLATFERAGAEHQTTADNPGTVPDPIVGPIIDFIDAARPLVNTLGARAITNGPTFYRPHVTQHTTVGKQSAEKAELPSQKMLIERLQVDVSTYGGFVNVSRQDIDWSSPSALQLVIDDLAAEYAIQTELAAGAALAAGGTTLTPAVTASSDAAAVLKAVWKGAGAVYAATKGRGRIVIIAGIDMLGVVGPLFPLYNPMNQQGIGFAAASFGQGAAGQVSGASLIVSAGVPAGYLGVMSTAAMEVYEQRIGTLQVIEPSVLGVQVAYAGYFAEKIITATGIQMLSAASS